ncbi:MAG: FGGY-family carbohydrate kinase [Actinomycetota bacterium]
MTRLLIGHDAGTGGCKSVLTDGSGEVLAASFEPYPTSYPGQSRVEQDPADWWRAVCTNTRRLVAESRVDPASIAGLGFAGQMVCVVPVDRAGEPVRPAIIWMDSRADAQAARMIRRLGGSRVMLAVAGALPTGKDVVCKVAWLEENEPDLFGRTHRILDLTGYLVLMATGELSLDHTGAGATGLLSGKREWSGLLARLIGFPVEKMPDIRPCSQVVGGLTADAASEMSLAEGTPVIAGMSDIPAAAVGSGALGDGDAHIYLGTSSWLCITTSRTRNLGRYGIAAVPSADPRTSIMIGETETAGACLEWFAREFATAGERRLEGGVFAALDTVASEVEPGAGRLLFMPWLFGERSPVPDTTLRGCFANLSLEHTRDHMLRAVYEGTAYNLRWLLDAAGSKGFACRPLRAIGGGAKSDLWMQVMADVTGREIKAVAEPQEAGAVGCALAAGVGLGLVPSYESIRGLVGVRRVFEPDTEVASAYDPLYRAFRAVYPALSKAGRALNR